MTANRSGLIVNVSSPGGLKYLFNVCYGIGKAAVDRMAADTAVELRKHGVAVVSLWPGPVATEYVKDKGLGELCVAFDCGCAKSIILNVLEPLY